MSTPYLLMRDARLVELDMLDCCDLLSEDQPFPDYRPLLKKFADRVGRVADGLEELDNTTKHMLRNNEIWKLLFESEDISLKVQSNHNPLNPKVTFMFVQETPNSRKLLGSGQTLKEAIEKTLRITL